MLILLGSTALQQLCLGGGYVVGLRPKPNCAHRNAAARNVMAAFRAFANWAVALPRKQL